MPANPGIDEGGTGGFNRLRQLDGLVKRPAAFHQIQHRQAEDDNKVSARTFAHGAYHFDGKAHTSRIIAAPFVVTLVSAGGEEFVNQIALGTHHLDAVIARFTRQRRTSGEVVNQRQHFIVAEGMRLEAVNRCLNGRRCHQIGLIAITPGMQDL